MEMINLSHKRGNRQSTNSGEGSLRFQSPAERPPLIRSQSSVDGQQNRKARPPFSRQNSILKMAPEVPAEKQRQLAIKVENVCLTYGEGERINYVLNGISLNVPKGEIYGLLGPSGCGKTSLLKIICGLMKPEYGSVRLFGYHAGTEKSGVPGPGIGYMPQDVALQTDLTIGEMLAFYGRLALMSEREIAERTVELIKQLELPEANRLIADLSGGQQRRVSLAVSLIHSPRLLILDEPTVGVDPLLCQKIWALLISLCTKHKMTVIITTHYIEEARRAHLVGFMRKGQLLSEGCPERLVRLYQTPTLEELFLRLCLNQKRRKSAIQALEPTRKMSIMYGDDAPGTSGTNRNSLKLAGLGTRRRSRPVLNRQGSFTGAFGEMQQQLAIIGQIIVSNQNRADPNNNDSLVSTRNFESGKSELTVDLGPASLTSVYSTPPEGSPLDENNNNVSKFEVPSTPATSNQGATKPSFPAPVLLQDVSKFPIKVEAFKPNYHSGDFINWIWRILAMSYKLHLQTCRQPLFLALMYLMPTLCMGALFLCIGHTPNGIKVAVINEEVRDHRHRDASFPNVPCDPKHPSLDYEELFAFYDSSGVGKRNRTGDYEADYFENIDGLGKLDRLRVPYIPDLFLKNVNQKIVDFRREYRTVNEAREAVRNRTIWGYVHFKPEFSRSFLEKDFFIKPRNQKYVTNEIADQGRIHYSGDYSDKFMTATISISFQEALIDTMVDVAKGCGMTPDSVKLPVEIKEFIYGEYIKGDYFGVRDFAAPGFFMCITYSMAMGLCTMQTLLELRDKMFVRNYSAGLTAGQMLISNVLGRIFLLLGSIFVTLFFGVNLFQIPFYGRLIDAVIILVLQVLVGMCNGLFVTTFILDITSCLYVSLGFLLVIISISGVFWPLEALPYYVRWFSRALPFTVPGEAFRTVLIRKNAPFSLIFPGILISFVWVLIFSMLSFLSFRRMRSVA